MAGYSETKRRICLHRSLPTLLEIELLQEVLVMQQQVLRCDGVVVA
jgi:hypothetical protein